MRIGIVGLGHVGSTVAYTLCLQGLADELVLLDKNKMKVQAEYLELSDTTHNLPNEVVLIKDDYAALKTADIIIFCAGDITVLENATDRLAELRVTSKIVEDVAPKIVQSEFSGVLISVTNPCDVIALYLAELIGFDKRKVIGSGTLIDTNRLMYQSGRDDVLVIGEHGESQVALDVPDTIEKLAAKTGWEIYAAKQHTAFGIASSVARIISVLEQDTRELLPISSYDKSAGCFYSTLAKLSLDQGVVERVIPALSNADRKRLQASVQKIKGNYDRI